MAYLTFFCRKFPKNSHFFGDWWFSCDLLCHFWWIFGWDWGTPAILRQNPNIYGQFQGKLSFGQFWKKVGIGSDPPSSLGQIPNFYRKFVLQASLMIISIFIKNNKKVKGVLLIKGKRSQRCHQSSRRNRNCLRFLFFCEGVRVMHISL